MNESTKCSCIVPIYNVEKYLPQCIESILNQTHSNFELILVDDGSPDNCGKICDEYEKKDNRIAVIHKKNGGVSAARNAGLDAATGEYICFSDSDDWLEKDYIEYLLNLSIENDAEYVLTDSMFTSEDSDVNENCNIEILSPEAAADYEGKK